jgi:hypothetical protein
MSLLEKAKKETTIKISGAMLMFLANVLRQRQVVIFMSLAEAIENDEHNVEDLENAAMANEVVGQKILSYIEAHIGKEDYEKFLDGDIDMEGFNPSGAIN